MITLVPNCRVLSATARMLEIHRALEERGAAVRVATRGGMFEWVLRDARVPYDLLAGEESGYLREIGARAVVTGGAEAALRASRVAGIPAVSADAGAWVPPMWERGLLPLPFEPVGIPFERCLPRAVRRRMFNARVRSGAWPRGEPADLTLVTDLPELLGITATAIDGWRPRDPAASRGGARLKLVGPILPRFAMTVPERVERLLAGPRPIVYVAMPSSEAGLVRAAVGALRSLGARILVAGPAAGLAGVDDDQVAVEGVLPGHLIMPRVDLAVVSGGQAGVQAALAAGVPFAGLPLGPEQHLNVALAEREGAARAIAPALAGTPELTAAARALMTVPRHRAAAERLREAFARADGAGRAAEAIIALASGVAVHPG
jgi:UDP:flavonoid glycosyltransferase YjiC (YdhE family)